MSINVNDKNLGHATAYAYYKAGGGTMTEAEFTEFMADFGTASQTAVESAQAALASKNAAQTAATTATTKASEATTAATTATTKAGEASTSASTATSAKDTAVSASQTATTKATEATTAAATATSAKTDAVAANTAAQSAKTAAQTAQTGAETAAASVQSSAAQIATNAEDISQLKSDLNRIYNNVVLTSSFINNYLIDLSGGVGSTAPISSPSYNTGFAYLLVKCKDGDKITITTQGGNTARAWAILDSDAKILSLANAGANVSNLVLVAEQDGYFVVNSNNTYASSRSAVYTTPKIDEIEKRLEKMFTTKDISGEYTNNYLIDLSGGVGSTAPISSPTYNTGFAYYLIPCKAGEKLTVTTRGGSTARAWAILDSDAKILSVAGANATVQNVVLSAEVDGYFVANSNNAYTQYRTVMYTMYTTDYLDDEINTEVFDLPSSVYGVVGVETNVYYENALQYGVMRTTARMDTEGVNDAERYSDRLIWKPTTSGTTQATIKMYKHNIKTPTETANINFVSAPSGDIGRTIKCLVIGDSKIAYGQIVGMLRDLFGESNLHLLGTRYGNNDSGDTTLRHEGRAGWSAGNYINSASVTVGGLELNNPFYNVEYTNPTYGGHFDFATYCSNQGYSDIDYVVINLGTNDFGVHASTYLGRISAMVDSIHAYDSNIKIILGLIEGVYMPKLEWATRNTAFHEFRKVLMSAFESVQNVYLNPQYLSMDLYNDYKLTEVPLSYADELYNTGKTRSYTADGIHQNNVGFYKNAVSIYSIIKCIESQLT